MASVVKQVMVVILAVPFVALIAGQVANWTDNERQFGGKTDVNSPISNYLVDNMTASPAALCRSEACTFSTTTAVSATTVDSESLNDVGALVLPPAVEYRAPIGGYLSNLRKPAYAPDLELPLGNSADGQAFVLLTEYSASGAATDVAVAEQGLITAVARSASPETLEDWQPARFFETSSASRQSRVLPIERDAKYARITWQPVPVMLKVRFAKQRLTQLQIGDQALLFFNPEHADKLDLQLLPQASALLAQVSGIEPLVGTDDALVLLNPVAGVVYRGEPSQWLASRAWHSRNNKMPQVLPERVHVTAWKPVAAQEAPNSAKARAKSDNPRTAAFRLPKTALNANCAKPAQGSKLDKAQATPTADPAASCVWVLKRDFAVPVQVRVLRDYGDSVTATERPVFAGLAIAATDWQALSQQQRRLLSASSGLVLGAKVINTASGSLSAGMAARPRDTGAPTSQ